MFTTRKPPSEEVGGAAWRCSLALYYHSATASVWLEEQLEQSHLSALAIHDPFVFCSNIQSLFFSIAAKYSYPALDVSSCSDHGCSFVFLLLKKENKSYGIIQKIVYGSALLEDLPLCCRYLEAGRLERLLSSLGGCQWLREQGHCEGWCSGSYGDGTVVSTLAQHPAGWKWPPCLLEVPRNYCALSSSQTSVSVFQPWLRLNNQGRFILRQLMREIVQLKGEVSLVSKVCYASDKSCSTLKKCKSG